jgi:hypothetical protein
MTDELDKSPQEQIKEGIWRIALWAVVIAAGMAFGIFIGYLLWGDAPDLRSQVASLEQQKLELKNEREAQAGRQALCERDKEDFKKRVDKAFDQKNECQRELAELKSRLGQ